MEGEGTVVVSALDKVLETIPEIFDLAGVCFNEIIENPVLLMFFSVSLIGLGLSVFRKLRRTATSR